MALNTVGALDLGGSSLEVTFVPPPSAAVADPADAGDTCSPPPLTYSPRPLPTLANPRRAPRTPLRAAAGGQPGATGSQGRFGGDRTQEATCRCDSCVVLPTVAT